MILLKPQHLLVIRREASMSIELILQKLESLEHQVEYLTDQQHESSKLILSLLQDKPDPAPKPNKPTIEPNLAKTQAALDVLTKELPGYLEFLRSLPNVTNYDSISKWFIGAAKNHGGLTFNTKTEHAKFNNPVPSMTQNCPLLEIQSRLNYYHNHESFVAKPRVFTELEILRLEKGNPIQLEATATKEDYEDFFNQFQFDHYVFWRQHMKSNVIHKQAVALVFYLHTDRLPDLDLLDKLTPKYTQPDLPPIRFSTGGYRAQDDNEEFLSILQMYPTVSSDI